MKKLFTLVVAALLVLSGAVAAQPDRRIPYRILPALSGAGVDQTALVSSCTVGQVLADDGAATDRFICADMMGGGGGVSTSDIIVRQIGTTVLGLVLPGSRNWVGTGITVPDGVHLILLDSGISSDDYHVIDWDTISADGAGVPGNFSGSSGEYETFIIISTTNTIIRIGHDGAGQILLANNIAGLDATLDHVRIERILAPPGETGPIGPEGPVGTGLSADTVSNLPTADVHSDVRFPGVQSGTLSKYTVGAVIGLAGSSAGLGDRLAPATIVANQCVQGNADGTGLTFGECGTGGGDEAETETFEFYSYATNMGAPVGPAQAFLPTRLYSNYYNVNTEIALTSIDLGVSGSGELRVLVLGADASWIVEEVLFDHTVSSTAPTSARWFSVVPSSHIILTPGNYAIVVYPTSGNLLAFYQSGITTQSDDDNIDLLGYAESDPIANVAVGQTLANPGAVFVWLNRLVYSLTTVTAGASTFASLTDTPEDYVGSVGKIVAVNSTPDGLEFIDAPHSDNTIPHYGRLPLASSASPDLIYLTNEYTEGNKQDATLTVGFANGEAGYSNGDLRPALGSFNKLTPLTLIGGAGTSSGYFLESVYSHNERWLTEMTRVEIGGTSYTLGDVFSTGNAFAKRITNYPDSLSAAALAINFRRADDTWYFTDGDNLRLRTGLYEKVAVINGFSYFPLTSAGLIHIDGSGSPEVDPTMVAQSYVNDAGALWVAGDDTTVTHEDGTITVSRFPLGGDTFYCVSLNNPCYQEDQFTTEGSWGYFGNAGYFVQERAGTYTTDLTWTQVWDYLISNSLGSIVNNTYYRDQATFIGDGENGYHTYEDVADALGRILGDIAFQTNTYFFFRVTSDLNTIGVFRVDSYVSAITTTTDDLFWKGPFLDAGDARTVIEEYIEPIDSIGTPETAPRQTVAIGINKTGTAYVAASQRSEHDVLARWNQAQISTVPVNGTWNHWKGAALVQDPNSAPNVGDFSYQADNNRFYLRLLLSQEPTEHTWAQVVDFFRSRADLRAGAPTGLFPATGHRSLLIPDSDVVFANDGEVALAIVEDNVNDIPNRSFVWFTGRPLDATNWVFRISERGAWIEGTAVVTIDLHWSSALATLDDVHERVKGIDSHGFPENQPTGPAQLAVNQAGEVFSTSDEQVTHTTEPSWTAGQVTDVPENTGGWDHWKGVERVSASVIPDTGDFLYRSASGDFLQKRSAFTDHSDNWGGVRDWFIANPGQAANAPANLFQTAGNVKSVLLRSGNQVFDNDAGAARYMASHGLPSGNPYVWFTGAINDESNWVMRLAQPGAFVAGTVIITTGNHWVGPMATVNDLEPALIGSYSGVRPTGTTDDSQCETLQDTGAAIPPTGFVTVAHYVDVGNNGVFYGSVTLPVGFFSTIIAATDGTAFVHGTNGTNCMRVAAGGNRSACIGRTPDGNVTWSYGRTGDAFDSCHVEVYH